MVGGDEAAVVERGERYVSTAEGTLGVSVRAFVPICTREGVQVGYVTVGTMEESLIEKRHEVVLLSGLFLVTGLILGTMGAILLARGLKKELLDKEPEELARLYREHEGMLEALHEGVVAIDARCQVTLINQRARQLIGIGDEQGLGVDIAQVMPTTVCGGAGKRQAGIQPGAAAGQPDHHYQPNPPAAGRQGCRSYRHLPG